MKDLLLWLYVVCVQEVMKPFLDPSFCHTTFSLSSCWWPTQWPFQHMPLPVCRTAFLDPFIKSPQCRIQVDVSALRRAFWRVCCCCRYLLEVGQVATVPGDAFGAPDCIRISYAASMADLEKAMERLSVALKKVIQKSEQ